MIGQRNSHSLTQFDLKKKNTENSRWLKINKKNDRHHTAVDATQADSYLEAIKLNSVDYLDEVK